jgi:aminoglycoside phosphotransferase (APT) family kinase protein
MSLTVHQPVQERLSGYVAVLAADGHLAGDVAVELRSGQFHDVVLTGDVAYRFPRDPQSRGALPQRIALLTALAGARLPAAIPAPVRAPELLARERMCRPLGSCYVALSRVHGRPADAAIATDPSAAAGLTRQLADLLDRMAAAGSEPAIRRAAPAASAGYWREWAGQVREVLFPLMSEAGRRRAAAELAAVQEVRAPGDTLVHGDLGGANLLLTFASGPAGGRAPVVAGILDWDEACIGNQANDLASLAVTFGWPLTVQIEQQRQSSDATLLPSARVIAATFALQQALPAALSGDVASLDDGLMQYR